MCLKFINKTLQRTIIITLLLLYTNKVLSQESYEIQVYSSPTTVKHTTIFELHSNISPRGPENTTDFSHPDHETLEITTGITSNFELGFYVFNRLNNNTIEYMGSHLRPRITVPIAWKWSFGTSLSFEAGCNKDPFTSIYDWGYEIRPIFDKTIQKNYFSLNPTLDGSFTSKEILFSPNIKYSFALNPKYSLGIEYYGVTGKPFSWEKYDLQTHQFFIVTDIYFDSKHEFEFGIGRGTTQSSDVWNIKLILGQRVSWKNKKHS